MVTNNKLQCEYMIIIVNSSIQQKWKKKYQSNNICARKKFIHAAKE